MQPPKRCLSVLISFKPKVAYFFQVLILGTTHLPLMVSVILLEYLTKTSRAILD